MVLNTNSPIATDLLITLDRAGTLALHQQVETAIREGIRSGRLPQGAALPPTRTLATDLGVSRGVVVEAYAQLSAEGYLTSHSGGYTRVAATTNPAVAPGKPGHAAGRAEASRRLWLRSRQPVGVPPRGLAAVGPACAQRSAR